MRCTSVTDWLTCTERLNTSLSSPNFLCLSICQLEINITYSRQYQFSLINNANFYYCYNSVTNPMVKWKPNDLFERMGH